MAATRSQGPPGLEDQVRQMISTGHMAQYANATERPVVRLPPRPTSQSMPLTQGAPSNPGLSRAGPQPVAQHSEVGSTPGPNNGMPPHRQSQKQRRTQGQAQYGPEINAPTNLPHRSFPPPQYRAQPQHRAQYQQQPQQLHVDPNAFQRRGQVQGYYQQPQQVPRQLFDPSVQRGPPVTRQPDWRVRQAQYLDHVAATEVASTEMSQAEHSEKEAFRLVLQQVIYDVCAEDAGHLPHVTLECFGSFKSGFASAGSDMDLVIVLQDGTPYTACFSLMEDDLPRVLEKRLLQLGYGAHLLTRTRVPIIKICERPDDSLLDRLRQEREKWDSLDNEQKYPHLHQDEEVDGEAETSSKPTNGEGPHVDSSESAAAAPNTLGNDHVSSTVMPTTSIAQTLANVNVNETSKSQQQPIKDPIGDTSANSGKEQPRPRQRREQSKPWTRERKAGPLDFPKSGVGIQCDINFFNPLGLHNTQLLRCYSMCDPRVRPMILFVKAWAKKRKINSSYSGTLSSYGYVLMTLHYLMNVAQPPVIPNLQLSWRPNPQCTPPGAGRTDVDGWTVDFWRNEKEITKAVQKGQMSTNCEPLGSLLAGFFQYYSSQGGFPQFHWMGDVLSLRTGGGILSKADKGWVKAMMEDGEGKKITHRYLFCIEDPFELAHNVARTVTHPGIVAIRDEFRRAWRILSAAGNERASPDGELFAELVEVVPLADAVGSMKTNDPAAPNAMAKGVAAQTPRSLDVTDSEAFPTLGGHKTRARKQKKEPEVEIMEGEGEISGDRAKAYLDELKRKKDEAHAEQTAYGAAESVLGGDD